MKTSILTRIQRHRRHSSFGLLTLLLLISCTFSFGQSSLIGNNIAGTGTNIFETRVKVVAGTPYVGFVNANASGYGSVMNLVGASAWGYTGTQNNSSHYNYNSYDIQVSPSGVIYIAFDDKAFSGKATVKKYSAGVWSIVGAAGFTPGAADNLSLAFDSGGTPYVTYRDGANSNGASVMKYNGTAWAAVGAPNFSLGATSFNKIIVDGSGFPYVLYMSDADNSIHVLRYGSSWAPLGGAVSVFGFGADMVFNPATNSIAVIYQDASSTLQLREMSTLGSSWNSLPSLSSYVPNDYKMIYASGSYYLGFNENSGYLRLFKYNAGAWSSVGSYLNVNGSAPSQIGLDIDNSNNTGYMSFRDGNASCSVVKFLPTGTIQVKQAATALVNNGPYNGNLTYDLGNTSYLQTTAVPFSITNTGLGKLSISSITSSNPTDFIVNTTATSMDIDPGQSTSFTVNFTPQGTSYRSSDIVVNNNDAAGNVQFAIKLSGTGVKGNATATWVPPAITYGTNLVSVLNAQGYYQGNAIPGSMAYKMDGVAVSPSTVPSAGTHALSVDFTPSDQSINAVTGKTATLTVNKATVTVTADPVQGKIYGAADPALTYTFNPNLIPGNSFSGALSRVTGENVGNYAISQGNLTASNYTISYTGSNFFITPMSIGVTVNTGQSKIYGALEPALTYTTNPTVIPGIVFTGALTRTAGTNVGNYPISQGNLSAGPNYTIGFTSGSFAITRKQITVTANASQSKVYGSLDPVLTFTPSPALLAGDSFFGNLSRATGENVGTYPIGINTLWAGNGGITNYDIFYNAANFSITPKPITVTATSGLGKVYGAVGDPTFTYTVNTPLLAGDSFFGNLTRAAIENAGTYSINIGSLWAGNSGTPNYTINYNSANFTITPKPITVTVTAGQTKVYGAADPAQFDYTFSPALLGTDVFTGSLSRIGGENVAGYAIGKNNLNVNSNYAIIFNGDYFFITTKTITVTASANQSKVYGAADPVFTYTPTPALIAGDFFIGALTRTAGTNVGNYNLSKGTLAVNNNNYNILFTAGSTFAITPKPITVTATAGQSKVYGTAGDPPFTYTVNTPLLAGDSFFGNILRTAGENAGAYAIGVGTLWAGNGGTTNYDITYNAANFTITPKPVTVTVTAGQSKVYGAADPATFTYTSFPPLVGTDVFTGSLSRAAGENVNAYAINQNGLNAGGNYSITYNGANFTITPKPVTITGVAGADKVYDGNATAVLTGGTLNGLLAADIGNVTISNGTGAFADKNVGAGKIVTATGYTLSGIASGNYSVAQPLINNAAISKAPLTITPDVKARVYGATDPAFTSTFTGLVNGETSAVAITGAPVYTTTATAASTVAGSPYAIHVDLNGVTSANYQLTAGADANLTITKADQTISFLPLPDRNKNDAPFDISAVADSGLPVTFSVLSGPATIINNTITLSGTSGIVKIIASQAGDANHNAATDAEQDFDVNNKPGATVSFANFGTTFGAAAFTPVATSNSSGVISYTVLPGGTGSATIANGKITPVNTGLVNIRASVTSDATYNGAYKDAVMTIDKATQTIPALGLVATYNVNNADIALPVSTSGNLAIAYASSDPAIAMIVNSNTLHFVGGAGQVTITATQAGNANYNAAALVTAVFTAKADQVITFNALTAKKYGDAPFTLAATGGASGNAVTYVSSDLNVATVSGSTVTIVGAGTVTITAKQAGNTNYNAAADVPQSLVINKADQTITFGALANAIVGSPSFSLAATSTSGLAVKYTSASLNVATINGATVTIVGAGSTVITATQAGDANYNAAPAVQQTLTVTNTRIIAIAGTLAFGDNILGVDHPSKSFTITNNGTGALTISAIAVPAGFAVDKTSGTVLMGQSMTVSITFTPGAAQDYNGVITVTSDATSGGNTLAVTAKGVLITALADQNTIEGIEVYPNPSKGVFTLRINEGDENASVTSINAVTQQVKLQAIEKNLYQLDLTDKADGLYLLKCKSGKSVVTIRVVKMQ